VKVEPKLKKVSFCLGVFLDADAICLTELFPQADFGPISHRKSD
jgi:hypothetical protein